MLRRDVLAELRRGKLSLASANEVLDDLIGRGSTGTAGAYEMAGLSAAEASALGHGASPADLVALRYRGWPETCDYCGRTIDVAQGFWWSGVRSRRQRLRHVVCPDLGAAYAFQSRRARHHRRRVRRVLGAALGKPPPRALFVSPPVSAAYERYVRRRSADDEPDVVHSYWPLHRADSMYGELRAKTRDLDGESVVIIDQLLTGAVRLDASDALSAVEKIWIALSGGEPGSTLRLVIEDMSGGLHSRAMSCRWNPPDLYQAAARRSMWRSGGAAWFQPRFGRVNIN